MDPIKVEMKIKKSTKGTHVYEAIDFEDNTNNAITTVYIQRSALPSPPPPHVILHVEIPTA